MDNPEQLDNKFVSFVKAVQGSALFHAALPLVAAVLVATEKKWPSAKDGIAGALLLLTSAGKVISGMMDFIKGSSDKPNG